MVVKNDCLSEASELFKDTNIQITSKGRPLLGSLIGSSAYVEQYIHTKVKKWCESLGCLSDIVRIHPQSVYLPFVRGIAGWWIFLRNLFSLPVRYGSLGLIFHLSSHVNLNHLFNFFPL